jgi:hypothetical protein
MALQKLEVKKNSFCRISAAILKISENSGLWTAHKGMKKGFLPPKLFRGLIKGKRLSIFRYTSSDI